MGDMICKSRGSKLFTFHFSLFTYHFSTMVRYVLKKIKNTASRVFGMWFAYPVIEVYDRGQVRVIRTG